MLNTEEQELLKRVEDAFKTTQSALSQCRVANINFQSLVIASDILRGVSCKLKEAGNDNHN